MSVVTLMANKKKGTKLPPLLDDDVDDDDALPAAAAPASDPPLDDDDLVAVLAELGGFSDATITVMRIGTNGREERCDKFMASELRDNIDLIRARFGAGTYWLYGHHEGRIKRKRSVSFAKTLDETRGGSDAGARSGPAAGGGDMAAAIDRMTQQQQQLFQMVLTGMNANRAPATDPMLIINAAEKLANMGNRRDDGGSLTQFMQLMKFAREFGGGNDGEPGLVSVGMEFAHAFRDMARGQQPAAIGGETTEGPQQMMAMVQKALAQQLPTLIRGAQSETDPTVYAQLVLDQLPQIYLAPLLRELAKPEWFTLLARVDGRVVPHQAWFEALRNEIVQATSPEAPPAA